jgi:hypothetical protein
LPHDLKEGEKHIYKKLKTEPHRKGRTTEADLKHGGAEGWLHPRRTTTTSLSTW